LTTNGSGSAITILAKAQNGGTGGVPGLTGVPAPRTADEAAELAERLVGALLPPSVQSWLTGMEQAEMVAGSVGMKRPPVPVLTDTERETLTTCLTSLSELLAPAGRRGTELEQAVTKLFAAFNVFTGDQVKLRAQVLVWCEELEGLPLYAIRKAYKWAVRGGDKLPSLASFLADVRFAVGADVLARKRLLEQLAGRQG
jgi:hypothetical protein